MKLTVLEGRDRIGGRVSFFESLLESLFPFILKVCVRCELMGIRGYYHDSFARVMVLMGRWWMCMFKFFIFIFIHKFLTRVTF